MALATLSVAPAMADDSAYSKAVALASADSTAGIEDIGYALYLAVQENPDMAAAMLATVLDQRNNWTAEQVSFLVTAVMMAHPDMTIPKKEHLTPAEGLAGGASADAAAGAITPVEGLVLAESVQNTMLGDVITVLYGAELPEGVASAVIAHAGLSDAVVSEPTPVSDAAAAEGDAAAAEGGDAATSEGGETATPEGGETATPETGDAATPGAAATTPKTLGSALLVNDLVGLNQSTISGSLGGDLNKQEIYEPTVNPPDVTDDFETPDAESSQN